MILGINGRINSGKDTVGKIIQILTSFPRISTERALAYIDKELTNNEFEIHKFADTLKDIVCILIGCTREMLEDRRIKSLSLQELADKGIISKEFVDLRENLLVDINGIMKNKITKKSTIRDVMQVLGTDLFRNQIHPNIWVNSLMSKYKPKWVNTGDSVVEEDVSIQKKYPSWIITDLRFPNEAEAIKQKGGIIINISRPKNDIEGHYDCCKSEDGCCIREERDYCPEDGCLEEHYSETALNGYEFDEYIVNDETIEQLIEKMRIILKSYNII